MAINRKSITFIGLAGVLAAGLGVLVAVTRPQEILTSTVTMQKTERVIAVVGRARPVDRIDVRPLYAGQVVRLLHDEGDTVAAGEPLAVIKADVEQAQTQSELARAQSARARAAEALQSYQRTKTLFDRGFAAEAALDQASAALRAAQADVAAAEATAKVAAARTRSSSSVRPTPASCLLGLSTPARSSIRTRRFSSSAA